MNNIPFLLSPAGKDYLWGGERLKTEYGKQLPLYPLAETWECSCHPEGPSVVASGPWKGRSLLEVLAQYPELLGSHPASGGLPVLVKLIDASKDLSVQVHPDDAFAWAHENQPGKSEMWYVIDALPGAQLVYGFNLDMTPERVRQGVADGSLMDDLQFLPVSRGDVFFIPPGTVHAIGAGVLLAEIQQSSNVTYRLYDYGRKDKDGKCRQLHIEKALQVLTLRRTPPVRRQQQVFRFQSGGVSRLLCRCRYFQVEFLKIQGRMQIICGENSFQVCLCTAGQGVLIGGGTILCMKAGDCVFLPAGTGVCSLEGTLEVLMTTC